jgi:small-conductance mechanosensitive channel
MEELQLLTAWREPLTVAAQVLLILVLAWLVQRLVTRGITRLDARYTLLPPEILLPLRGLLRWFIIGSAMMLVLERLGVSAEVLWAALTGFAAVAAVAFFASGACSPTCSAPC